MNVKMLQQTYRGRALLPGQTVEVPDDVAERWISNGIAEAAPETVPLGPNPISPQRSVSTLTKAPGRPRKNKGEANGKV